MSSKKWNGAHPDDPPIQPENGANGSYRPGPLYNPAPTHYCTRTEARRRPGSTEAGRPDPGGIEHRQVKPSVMEFTEKTGVES